MQRGIFLILLGLAACGGGTRSDLKAIHSALQEGQEQDTDEREVASQEATKTAEEEARQKAGDTAKPQAAAGEGAGKNADDEARQKAEEEAKKEAAAEDEAKKKADDEERRKAQDEAKNKADDEARQEAEEEAKKEAAAEDEAKTKARIEKLTTYISKKKCFMKCAFKHVQLRKLWSKVEKSESRANDKNLMTKIYETEVEIFCSHIAQINVIRKHKQMKNLLDKAPKKIKTALSAKWWEDMWQQCQARKGKSSLLESKNQETRGEAGGLSSASGDVAKAGFILVVLCLCLGIMIVVPFIAFR